MNAADEEDYVDNINENDSSSLTFGDESNPFIDKDSDLDSWKHKKFSNGRSSEHSFNSDKLFPGYSEFVMYQEKQKAKITKREAQQEDKGL